MAYFINFVNKTASVFEPSIQYIIISFVMVSAIRIGFVENKDVKLSFMSLISAFIKVFFIQQIFYAFFCTAWYIFESKVPIKVDASFKIASTYASFWMFNNFWEKFMVMVKGIHWSSIIFVEAMKSLFNLAYFFFVPAKIRAKLKDNVVSKYFAKLWEKYEKINVGVKTLPKYTMKEIDSLGDNGRKYEEFVALFYKNEGFRSYTTTELKEDENLPASVMRMSGNGEQGVDVVVFFEKETLIDNVPYTGLLIQCKQYSSTVGNKAIQEIYGAIPMYEKHFKQKFKPLCWTNNYYTPHATELAKANGVGLIDRNMMMKLLGIETDDGLFGNPKKAA
jgi:restriction system protein